jgi:hypothetical protein
VTPEFPICLALAAPLMAVFFMPLYLILRTIALMSWTLFMYFAAGVLVGLAEFFGEAGIRLSAKAVAIAERELKYLKGE